MALKGFDGTISEQSGFGSVSSAVAADDWAAGADVPKYNENPATVKAIARMGMNTDKRRRTVLGEP